ncbi:MAG: transcription-repair coupling factor, partial [Methylococcaceae bacterium]|nr:transcription-repair coupling factor [Methylococcaceae bacterium]
MANNSLFTLTLPQIKNQTILWTGLTGCANALALATAIEQENRLFVIVTPDNQTALQLIQELTFFLQNKHPILHFPDWETLPYDVFSPLPEITSERIKTLALLPELKRGALVVSVNTLMHKLAPREHVLANSFAIKVGDVFNLELNRLKLE